MTIFVENVLTTEGWKSEQAVDVESGLITAIRPVAEHERTRVQKGYLIPGYVDTQVNGGGGVLFNSAPTLAGVNAIANAHLHFGTTSMLPTVITDNADIMEQAADAVAQSQSDGPSTIEGIHFEGPFLNTTKKGVHDKRFIRYPSERELSILTRKDIGKVMVTLAPEQVDSALISELAAENIVVSLGHTNATAQQVYDALNAGATGFTHLYNAMSPLTSRAPGVVGAAFNSASSYAGLIVDHHHVHPDSAKIAIKIKGKEKLMLVTDAMAHVGSSLNTLAFFDTEITKSGSRLTTPDGTLAGSCLDMHSAVINTHQDLGFSLEDSVYMASQSPADFLGLGSQLGLLACKKKANFILLNEQQELVSVWLQGKTVTQSQE